MKIQKCPKCGRYTLKEKCPICGEKTLTAHPQKFSMEKEKKYATDAEIETIDQRVKDLVDECEKFAEESPFPEPQQMYDVVYEQENYPFISHRL